VLRNRATVLGLAVSLVFLTGVVWWATQQEPPSLPQTPGQLLALAGAVALYGLNTAVRAERWHALLRQAGATPRRADTYALTVIGYTGNNVLPARAGDAVRVVLAAPRAATTMRTVVGTLLAERLLDVAVVVTLFVLVGYAALGAVSRGDLEIIGLATAAAIVAMIVAVVVFRRSERALRFVKPMLASMLDLRRGRHGGRMLAVTALIWWIESLVWMATGAAVGLEMNPLEALYVVGLASVFALVPSGPAYVGTQDAAVVIAVKALGGSNSLAVSYILMLRFVIVVPITVVGFVLLAARYGGISQLRAARAQARTVEPR
jgi:glycosyltransferase 2 family protein